MKKLCVPFLCCQGDCLRGLADKNDFLKGQKRRDIENTSRITNAIAVYYCVTLVRNTQFREISVATSARS
jgi:hypothetical protein